MLSFDDSPHSVDDLGPLNHSCDPNLAWTDDRTLTTRRDVHAGAELTVDYSTVVTDPGFALMCHCETYRCRQLVEGSDWQIPQLQARYTGGWHPRIQALIDGSAPPPHRPT